MMAETPSKQSAQSRPSLKGKTTTDLHNTRLAWVAIALLLVIAASIFVGAQIRISAAQNVSLGNVRIGGVDVSNMDKDQIMTAVSDVYAPRVSGQAVYVYASEEDMASESRNPEVTDLQSLDEVRAQTVAWATNATNLDAQIDYAALADQAIAAGKDNLFNVLGIHDVDTDIPVTVNLNSKLVDQLAREIDYSLGVPFVNSDVTIEGDTATIIEGHDGNIVNRDWFSEQLSDALLKEDAAERAFVAVVEHHDMQISPESAQKTADLINAAISDGMTFTCGDVEWSIDSVKLAHWIRTEVLPDGEGGYKLQPYINGGQAKSALLVSADAGFAQGSAKMTFERSGDKINVKISGADKLPLVTEAVENMDNVLFGGRKETPLPEPRSNVEVPHVDINTAPAASQMTLDEAMDNGIVTVVSEYTTEYSSGADARNHNIHLAADLIDLSITKGGEVWSFNDIVGGECDAEKGFQAAATIADNQTVDAIGGGICQVATTVFNAAYNAGYEIVERTNHSLYIPSYPAGLDATIAYPHYDLKFRNETASDILLDMSHTDTTVTATIYGIDPGYTVKTDTGELLAGEKPKVRYEYDSSLAPGTSYTKSYGSDGQQITVIRYVYNDEGAEVRTDTFHSNYSAVDTVIAVGDQSAAGTVGGDEDYQNQSSDDEYSYDDSYTDEASVQESYESFDEGLEESYQDG